MATIMCPVGHPIEGDDRDQLIRAARAEVAANHPDLPLSDAQVADYVDAALRLGAAEPRRSAIGPARIRPLAPALAGDYLQFFERDAFADNPGWAGCYCAYYHIAGSEQDWAQRLAADNRATITELIEGGQAQGYLAYVDDRVVGWCKAGPRAALPGLSRIDPSLTAGGEQIGAIACFVIAPPYRRHGLARRLLEAACEGLRERGCAIAEAYPARQPRSGADAEASHGPLSLYLAAGFHPVSETGRSTVVQKALGAG